MARPRKVSNETVEAIIRRRQELDEAQRRGRIENVAAEFNLSRSTISKIYAYGWHFRVYSSNGGRTLKRVGAKPVDSDATHVATDSAS